MEESGSEIDHYDLLPDKLIVYAWPNAGGTKFDFQFRVRYGIHAKTAASTVYDYYNPDASTTLEPQVFNVR
jgi:hypothetical protein